MLEAHYFFVPDRPFLNLTTGNWGIGPFVAIQAGNESALSGLGFGLMIGFRQPSIHSDLDTNLSWNFGIGAIYDPSVKVLGNGIVADRPLPVGETMLRTTEVGELGPHAHELVQLLRLDPGRGRSCRGCPRPRLEYPRGQTFARLRQGTPAHLSRWPRKEQFRRPRK